jgi:hypothetical protein
MKKTALIALATAVVLAGGLTAAPLPSQAQETTRAAKTADGALTFSGGAVAAGIGFVWGSGELEYQGTPHPVKVSGLSVVDVGAAKLSASGSVYNLKSLQDFDGIYTTFSAGATVAGGGGVAYLRNEHGVVIKLHDTSEGLRLNLSADGVKLKVEG